MHIYISPPNPPRKNPDYAPGDSIAWKDYIGLFPASEKVAYYFKFRSKIIGQNLNIVTGLKEDFWSVLKMINGRNVHYYIILLAIYVIFFLNLHKSVFHENGSLSFMSIVG